MSHDRKLIHFDENGNIDNLPDALGALEDVGAIAIELLLSMQQRNALTPDEFKQYFRLFLGAHNAGCPGCDNCRSSRRVRPGELGRLLFRNDVVEVFELREDFIEKQDDGRRR